MQTTIQQWGNSLGARIPAPFAEQLHLKKSSKVEIQLTGDSIVITPIQRKKYTLDELVNGITPENRHDEVDTGYAVGQEFG